MFVERAQLLLNKEGALFLPLPLFYQYIYYLFEQLRICHGSAGFVLGQHRLEETRYHAL